MKINIETKDVKIVTECEDKEFINFMDNVLTSNMACNFGSSLGHTLGKFIETFFNKKEVIK